MWIEEETLQGHTDWVRDVSYAPSIGMPKTYLASASQVREIRREFLLMAGQNGYYMESEWTWTTVAETTLET